MSLDDFVRTVCRLPSRAQIDVDQFAAISRTTPAALLGSTLNGVIVTLALWGHVSALSLLLWLAALSLVGSYVARSWFKNRGRQFARVSPRAIRSSIVVAVALALPWAYIVACYLGTLPHNDELILIALCAGMAASGSVYLAPVYPAAIVYLAVILLPAAIKCFLLPGYGLLGCLILSYSAFLVAVVGTAARLSIERTQLARASSQRNALLQGIVDNFPGGISYIDSNLRIAVMNDRAQQMLEVPGHLFAAGPPTLESIFRFNAARGEYGPGDAEAQVNERMALARAPQAHVFERTRPNGLTIEVRGLPIDGGGFITTYTDISERRKSEAKIAYMAHHDVLTGVGNRALFNERLDAGLPRVELGGHVAVHLVDLDNFKDVNDDFGHPAGDKLLTEAARRLQMLARASDTVVRMGGDEFAIVQTGVEKPSDAARLADRIVEGLAEPFEIDTTSLVVSASVGVALAPSDGRTAEELLRNADLALYHAKQEGRSTFRFYRPEVGAERQERRILHGDLQAALSTGTDIEVHYQPIVDVSTRQKVAMEALVRWRHPTRGLVPPSLFAGLAEETGLIKALGKLVLRRACTDAALWPSTTKVAVNLSPLQFLRTDLVDEVDEVLRQTGLSPQRLELEITESVLLNRKSENIDTLRALRQLGVAIALDDFGTGYSSLSYLRHFPLDKIKIDKSFVSELSEQDEAAAIVCAIANLGRSLRMTVTAEGVETDEQLELVRAAGCTQAQGYLLGRPRPSGELDFADDCERTSTAANAAISARDVMLVRASFARITPAQDAVADSFYDRLFVLAPDLRSMFPQDLVEQKRKLMAMLSVGVGKLHDLSDLLPVIKDLGARHAHYGTKVEHYAVVGEALLWALERELHDRFTPDVRAAWEKIYGVLATTMQEGASEQVVTRAA